ncbi:surface lipoprotein assembly modifier [Moraxella nasovis]|uniref:surface lipoprotein assembly modifier n=1 Tax=Moraxella nasovis TaxID=2904121 RepID=UPI001F622FB3|nr:surface lipoprotein assembly modifier [Moraxella nasovis]UNU74064.1 surface lipoprotein assembly modifier [Moraxella nasovis]
MNNSFKPNMATLGILLLSITLSKSAFANDKTIITEQDDKRIQDRQLTHIQPPPTLPQVHLDKTMTAEQTLSISADELVNYPTLIHRAMAAALMYQHDDDVVFLLPYYEQLPKDQQDQIALSWARGVSYEKKGNLPWAIREYRNVLSHNHQANLVRLRLAVVLSADKQFNAAEDQFTKILSDKEVPADVANFIGHHLAAIKRQNQASFGGGINFLNDKNINNAPKNKDLGGGWVAPQAQSAQGFGINFDAQKKWRLQDGFFGEMNGDIRAKYYWNNKPYNELTGRISAAIGHENARHSISIAPFVEKNYYAGGGKNTQLQYFSDTKGVSADFRYWLTPNWRLSASGELASLDYTTRHHLDGSSRHVGANLMYVANPKSYYFVGVDRHKNNAQDGDDSFVRRGVRVGTGQDLPYGFGMQLTANYAKKDYRAAGFFGKVQHNDEYGAGLSLWHKKLYFGKLTPRLTWQYQKVDSNLPLYQYDKHKVFVELNQRF